MDQQDFTRLLGPLKALIELNDLLAVIDKVPFLDQLQESERDALAQAMRRQRFSQGDVVFHQGEPGDAFYVVREGSVEVNANGVRVGRLVARQFFGEEALLAEATRSASVVAASDVEVVTDVR